MKVISNKIDCMNKINPLNLKQITDFPAEKSQFKYQLMDKSRWETVWNHHHQSSTGNIIRYLIASVFGYSIKRLHYNVTQGDHFYKDMHLFNHMSNPKEPDLIWKPKINIRKFEIHLWDVNKFSPKLLPKWRKKDSRTSKVGLSTQRCRAVILFWRRKKKLKLKNPFFYFIHFCTTTTINVISIYQLAQRTPHH